LQIVPKHKFFLVYQFSNGKSFSMTRPFILYYTKGRDQDFILSIDRKVYLYARALG